jgi:hypothetical protein
MPAVRAVIGAMKILLLMAKSNIPKAYVSWLKEYTIFVAKTKKVSVEENN